MFKKWQINASKISQCHHLHKSTHKWYYPNVIYRQNYLNYDAYEQILANSWSKLHFKITYLILPNSVVHSCEFGLLLADVRAQSESKKIFKYLDW